MTTILVAEDNRVNQRMLIFTLRKSGYTVVPAMHGQEALDQMAETHVDLVITDVEMPEMNGITLIEQMRADEKLKSVPAIVLTASVDEAICSAAKTAGADGILTKPTSSHELIHTVKELLNR